jgi:hypothetical protein
VAPACKIISGFGQVEALLVPRRANRVRQLTTTSSIITTIGRGVTRIRSSQLPREPKKRSQRLEQKR